MRSLLLTTLLLSFLCAAPGGYAQEEAEATTAAPPISDASGTNETEDASGAESASPDGGDTGEAATSGADDASWIPGIPNELFFFFGRFHPLVLHFPIGVLVALALVELVVLFQVPGRDTDTARWLLLIVGAISATVAAVLGLFLSWSGSYNADLVWWHKWTGAAVAVGAVLALLCKIRYERTGLDKYGTFYGVLLFVTVIVLVPTGHYGAALTHGSSYLTKYLPEPLAFLGPVLGESSGDSALPAGDTMFAQEILPIFEAKCFECHGVDKQEGLYRMDLFEDCLAGGESGNVAVVPGDAMASYLVELILLPVEHNDVMPPEGKSMLEPAETVALVSWVNRGAPWGDYVPPEPTEPEEIEITLAVGGEAAGMPLVDSKEIMQLFFEDSFDALRLALLEEPKGRKAMKTVYNSAFGLGEAHNLLFLRMDEEYMFTDEWSALSLAGLRASQAVGVALKSGEYEKMKESFVGLVKSCNDCHDYFELKVDPVTVEIPPPEEEDDRPRRRRRRK